MTIGQYPCYSLFKFQAGTRLFWPPVCLSSGRVTLPHKILAVVSIVSFLGGGGQHRHFIMDLLAQLNNNIFWPLPLWIQVSESFVTVSLM